VGRRARVMNLAPSFILNAGQRPVVIGADHIPVCPHDGPFAPRPRTPVLEAGRQATSRKMVAIATRPSANAAHTAAITDGANLICSTSIMRETPRAIGWSLPTCRDGLPRVWRGARVAKSRVGTAPRRRLGGRKCRPNAARNIGALWHDAGIRCRTHTKVLDS
jgi:hypothetical protein